jgi:hypothetical protein
MAIRYNVYATNRRLELMSHATESQWLAYALVTLSAQEEKLCLSFSYDLSCAAVREGWKPVAKGKGTHVKKKAARLNGVPTSS